MNENGLATEGDPREPGAGGPDAYSELEDVYIHITVDASKP